MTSKGSFARIELKMSFWETFQGFFLLSPHSIVKPPESFLKRDYLLLWTWLSFQKLFQSFQASLPLTFHIGKTLLSKKELFWSDRESSDPGCDRVCSWNHPSVLSVLPNPSFSLKISSSLECEVGACSCWTRDHGKSPSVRIKFQALWVARSGQECDLWFLHLPNKWKGICLGTAGLMTPKRSSSYLHA